jgi:hypothetical protein
MKKEYTHPVAEQVPLLMDQSVCQMSTMRYILITDEVNGINPTVYDQDSD